MLEINKIHNIDCLEGLKQLPDSSVDLIITDPPYNLGKDFENDNLDEYAFNYFLAPILKELARVIKPKHSVIIFFDNGKKLPLFWKALFNSPLKFQKGGTWYKPNDCSMPHNRTLRTSEVFFICSKTEELNHEGDAFIHDCLISNHKHKEGWYHPTAKDLGIFRTIIKANSKQGWLVVDPFMGSGTTAKACKELGRNFIGFEINEEYCKIAEDRLKQQVLFGTLEAIQ